MGAGGIIGTDALSVAVYCAIFAAVSYAVSLNLAGAAFFPNKAGDAGRVQNQCHSIVYDVSVGGRDIFHFNRMLAKADKYLVENVDEQAAMRVKSGGEIFTLPLNLVSTSGAPCRVVVRQPL